MIRGFSTPISMGRGPSPAVRPYLIASIPNSSVCQCDHDFNHWFTSLKVGDTQRISPLLFQ